MREATKYGGMERVEVWREEFIFRHSLSRLLITRGVARSGAARVTRTNTLPNVAQSKDVGRVEEFKTLGNKRRS